MQSIGGKAAHIAKKTKAPVEQTGGGLVLPRFMRKPARLFHRLMSGGVQISRRKIAIYGFTLVLGVSITSVLIAQSSNEVLTRFSHSLGLAISQYDVSGNIEVSDVEIVTLLAPHDGSSIFSYDVEEARKLLKANPWIAEATVSKIYPNKISVNLEERDPYALWQNDYGLQMIDSEGHILAEYDGRSNDLPLVVGVDGAKNATAILATVSRYPEVFEAARAYIRVGKRRWNIELDLHVDREILVLLPENNIDVELKRLAGLMAENKVVSHDIRKIDLRFSDRMIVQMSPNVSKVVSDRRAEQIKILASAKKERKI